MSERNDNSAMYLLTGMAIGAAAALFFSPRSGEENRERLKTATKHANDMAAEKADAVRSSVHKGVSKAQDARHRIMDKSDQVADTIESEVRDKTDKAADKLTKNKGREN